MWFQNMKYIQKLLLCFAAIIGLGLVPLVLSLSALYGMRESIRISNAESKEMILIQEARARIAQQQIEQGHHMLSGLRENAKADEQLAGEVNAHLDQLAAAVESEEERAEIRSIKSAVAAYTKTYEQLWPLLREGQDRERVGQELAKYAGQVAAVDARLKALVTDSLKDTSETQQEAGEAAATSLLISLLGALIGVLAGIALSIVLARSITRPLVEFRTAAEQVSLGNFSAKISTQRKDEIGELAEAFGRMVAAVRFFAAENEKVPVSPTAKES